MVAAIGAAVDAFRATLVEPGAVAGAADSDAAKVSRRNALLVESATAWADRLGRLLGAASSGRARGVLSRLAAPAGAEALQEPSAPRPG